MIRVLTNLYNEKPIIHQMILKKNLKLLKKYQGKDKKKCKVKSLKLFLKKMNTDQEIKI